MSERTKKDFLGQQKDCYYATDPRVNSELAASLKGKNVVVAGAGRGVGRACAQFLAHASAKSLSVMALELDEVNETATLCKEINPDLLVKTAVFDVTDYDKVDAFVKAVDAEFGGVDVLLMNAGRPPQWLPTAECDPKIWWDTVAVSLQGAFNFSRSVLPIMQLKKEGRIIFTSSAGAHATAGMSSYIVAKLGMVRLCEILHCENYKQYNVKAFAYNPGAVRTRFYSDFADFAQGQQKAGSYLSNNLDGEQKSAQTAVKAFEKTVWATPELAAGLVTCLASGTLDHMSGRYLDASKDVAEYLADKEVIKELDLHRVRLHAAADRFIPSLDF